MIGFCILPVCAGEAELLRNLKEAADLLRLEHSRCDSGLPGFLVA